MFTARASKPANTGRITERARSVEINYYREEVDVFVSSMNARLVVSP